MGCWAPFLRIPLEGEWMSSWEHLVKRSFGSFVVLNCRHETQEWFKKMEYYYIDIMFYDK